MKAIPETVPPHIAAALDELGVVLGGKIICLTFLSEEELYLCFPGNVSQDAIRGMQEVMFDLLEGELLNGA